MYIKVSKFKLLDQREIIYVTFDYMNLSEWLHIKVLFNKMRSLLCSYWILIKELDFPLWKYVFQYILNEMKRCDE